MQYILKTIFYAGVSFILLFVTAGLSTAQQYTRLDPRFIVNTPYSAHGSRSFVASNQGASAANSAYNWGRVIDSEWINIAVIKASDTTGCSGLSPLMGAFALVYRNTNCSFSEQAYEAQQAGAAGVVIVNNSDKLDLVMYPGTSASLMTIPVIMIPKQTGDSLGAILNGGLPVYVTLTGWGLNLNHDLAIANPIVLPPYSAIPLTQMKPGNGNPALYNLYDGSVIANAGRSDESGVSLISTVDFTPSGGSASQLYQDSVTLAAFRAADSISYLLSPAAHNVNTTVAGRYDLKYFLHAVAADMYPQDNYSSASMYVTDGTFCKSKYDAANDKPIVNSSSRIPTAAPAYTWGPLFYVAKGGYQALTAKMALNDNDTSKHDLHFITDEIFVLFRWRDVVNPNGVIEPSELKVVGIAPVHFSTADSNDKVVSSNVFLDPVTLAQVFLEDTTYYWVAAVTAANYSLGTNTHASYYTRMLAAAHQATSVKEFWAPASDKGINDTTFMLKEADSVLMYPRTTKAASYFPIDSFDVTVGQYVPAISFHIGTVYNPVLTKNERQRLKITIGPNPATDYLNVTVSDLISSGALTVLMMNEAGQVVYKDKLNGASKSIRISTKMFPTGIYYLITTDGQQTSFDKFTIVK